jgi:hypothetical protein
LEQLILQSIFVAHYANDEKYKAHKETFQNGRLRIALYNNNIQKSLPNLEGFLIVAPF